MRPVRLDADYYVILRCFLLLAIVVVGEHTCVKIKGSYGSIIN